MPLPLRCLMLVSDRSLAGGPGGLVAAVEQAVAGGVDAVQLREKDLPGDGLLALARRLRAVIEGRCLLLVNGPLKVALAAGADGLHLPEDAPFPRGRGGLLVGRSVHSLPAARRAEAEGADYLIAGPVYETPSHPDAQPGGPPLVEEIAASVAAPVLAIGGVTAGRVPELVEAGAAGVAVISAVLDADDRRKAAKVLREALDAAWARRAASGARR